MSETSMIEEAKKALEVKYKPLVDFITSLPKSDHFNVLSEVIYKDPMFVSGADRAVAGKMLEQLKAECSKILSIVKA